MNFWIACVLFVLEYLLTKYIAPLFDRHVYKYFIYSVYQMRKRQIACTLQAKKYDTPSEFSTYAKLQRKIAALDREIAQEKQKWKFTVGNFVGKFIWYGLRGALLIPILLFYRWEPVFHFPIDWCNSVLDQFVYRWPFSSSAFHSCVEASGYTLPLLYFHIIIKIVLNSI